MKILTLHVDSIEVVSTKQAVKDADEEHAPVRANEALVAFCAIEKEDEADPKKIAEKAAAEIESVVEQVKAKEIVVYPYVHLTSNPSSIAVAKEVLAGVAAALEEKQYVVKKAPFGWYKSFTLKAKGHPLAELSRQVYLEGVVKADKVAIKKKAARKAGKIILDRRNLPPNDHRILGQELKIFHFADDVGAGLPLFLPNGATLWKQLEDYMRKIEERDGYRYVRTPHITKGSLFEATGHLPYYADSMYPPTQIEEQDYYLRPMNCPHHHMIFRELVKSYNDLPLRLA